RGCRPGWQRTLARPGGAPPPPPGREAVSHAACSEGRSEHALGPQGGIPRPESLRPTAIPSLKARGSARGPAVRRPTARAAPRAARTRSWVATGPLGSGHRGVAGVTVPRIRSYVFTLGDVDAPPSTKGARMRKLGRRVGILIATFVLAIGGSAVAAAPAQAELGGVYSTYSECHRVGLLGVSSGWWNWWYCEETHPGFFFLYTFKY